MRPVPGIVWGCALALLAAGAEPCRAAWCNVFQVCCNCGGPSASYAPPAYTPSASYASPDPCCNPCCPPPTCTTRYVQRTYYQPVTTYTTRTYYEPVTTYRTSYYYEPVTSYRYTSYYDPCTGCCQQRACPTTCYQLRSQCCPVQSWAQRCCQVPCTTYQQSCYWEPVTTCCPTPCCNGAPSSPPAAAAPPITSAPPSDQPPGVTEQHTVPPPAVGETQTPGTGTSNKPYDIYRPQPQPQAQGTMPPATSFQRQLTPQAPGAPRLPIQTAPPPTVHLDRIVLAPTTPSVEGQVVRDDRAPLGGVRVLFVNADRQGAQQTVTADSTGKFQVSLTSGNWLVYVPGANGKLVYHTKIQVREEQTQQMTLVSR